MPDPSFILPPDPSTDPEKKKNLQELLEKFKKEKKEVKEVVKEKEIKEESERAKILKEYNNMESNIPINHRYWKLPRG